MADGIKAICGALTHPEGPKHIASLDLSSFPAFIHHTESPLILQGGLLSMEELQRLNAENDNPCEDSTLL